MADPVFIDNQGNSSANISAVLFLADDAFGVSCFHAAERLLPDVRVTRTRSSGTDEALAEHRPELVVLVSNKVLPDYDSAEIDKKARDNGSMYLTLVASPDQLLVGPLFGSGRSCANCWAIRRGWTNSREDARKEESVPVSNHVKPTLGGIAIAAMLSLLRRESSLFTSPYILYDRLSRQVSHGTLTSTHACATCRQQLRNLDGGNVELRELIRTQVQAKHGGGSPRHES